MPEQERVSFVFLDQALTPWKVETWGKEIWLFYWQVSFPRWVPLRLVRPGDLAEWNCLGSVILPDWQARLYQDLSDRHWHREPEAEQEKAAE